MDSITLGKRIREARLAKKMTQAEVVGTFITRNMLSQIESGNATPSLQTLEYLAGVLEIPPSQLIEEERAPSQQQILLSAKQAYREGDYDRVIEIIGDPDEDGDLYDELCLLLSRVYAMQGNGEKSSEYQSKTIYN